MNYVFLALLISFLAFIDTGSALYLAGKGDDSYKRGEYGDAEVYYHRALEKDSSLWQVTYNLANVLYKQERYEESITYYKKSLIKADPSDHLIIFHNLGNAYYKINKLDECIMSYKKTLRKQPGASKTRYNLAFIQQLLDKQQAGNAQEGEKKERNQTEEPSKQPNDAERNRENSSNQRRDEKETSMTETEIENLLYELDQQEKKVHQQIIKKKNKQAQKKTLLNDW